MRITHLALVFLFACSGSAGSPDAGTDAAAPDSTDAPSPDAEPPAPVSVVVTREGVAMPDLPVIASDPVGVLVGQTTTDLSGAATLEVPVGGMLTVLHDLGDGDVKAVTHVGVQPGEALRVALKPAEPVYDPPTSVTASVPSFGSGTFLWINAGPSTSSTSANSTTLSYLRYWPVGDTSTTYTLLNRISDASYATLAWSVSTLVDRAATSVTLPAWSTTLDTATAALRGLPADATETGLTTELLLDGHWRHLRLQNAAPVEGAADFTTPLPPVGELLHLSASANLASIGDVGRGLLFHQVGLVSEHAISVDLTSDPLPIVNDVAFDLPATGVPTITWAATGDGSALDAAVLNIYAYRGARALEWYVVLPPAHAPSVALPTFPDLPGDLAALAPALGDEVYVSVILVDVDEVTTPAAYRADGLFWSRSLFDRLEDGARTLRARMSIAFTPD